MKRQVIFLGLLLVCGWSYGQWGKDEFKIYQESWLFGGSAGFVQGGASSMNGDDSNETIFQIAPVIGYAVGDNLIVGVDGGFRYSGPDDPDSENTQNTSYGVTSFVRQYFPLNKNLAFNLQVEIGFFKGTIDTGGYFDQDVSSSFTGIRGGLSYFLSHDIALTTAFGALGYCTSKNKYTSGMYTGETIDSSSFKAILGLSQIVFGLVYVL